MTIDYKIEESDYLTHQLFIVSKSDRIRRKTQRSKILIPLIYVALGLLFLWQDNSSLTILFIILGLLWYFIYPLWEQRYYINHYKGFIKENYKGNFGRTITLEWNNEYFLAKDKGCESKVLTSELEDICEIPTIIFVRLKGGQSFILPKDKITDFENVKTSLKALAEHLKINYNLDENWEWK